MFDYDTHYFLDSLWPIQQIIIRLQALSFNDRILSFHSYYLLSHIRLKITIVKVYRVRITIKTNKTFN